MSTLSWHDGRAGSALQAEVSEYIAAVQKLSEVLINGSVGKGHRAWEEFEHLMGMYRGSFFDLRALHRRAQFFFWRKLAEALGAGGSKGAPSMRNQAFRLFSGVFGFDEHRRFARAMACRGS